MREEREEEEEKKKILVDQGSVFNQKYPVVKTN